MECGAPGRGTSFYDNLNNISLALLYNYTELFGAEKLFENPQMDVALAFKTIGWNVRRVFIYELVFKF
jgi:hypothetical protein